MRNLEQFISEWRQEMMAAGFEPGRVLDELESHLREDVERRIRAGTMPEQAFHKAVEQLGKRTDLAEEFDKAEGRLKGRERLRRWSVIIAAGFVYSVLAVAWWIGARQGKMEITAAEISLAAAAVIPMVVLGWIGRVVGNGLPAINDRCVIVGSLIAVFLATAVVRVFTNATSPSSVVHLQIALLWLLSPLMGFANCISAWADKCIALRKSRRIQFQ